MYTLDLSKLTEEQLKAFELIDFKAASEEREKRSIYTEEDIRKGQIYTDLSKAYFFLKPMYDNMRNTDVKKTITESEILPVLEKVFRFCNVRGVKYEKFAPVAEPEVAQASDQVSEQVTDQVTEQASDQVTEQVVVPETVSPIDTAGWAPQEVVEARETFPEIKVVPLTPNPTIIPMMAPEVTAHPVETMPEAKLNEILASIPVVNKI